MDAIEEQRIEKEDCGCEGPFHWNFVAEGREYGDMVFSSRGIREDARTLK
jgi:hypothetical protein